MAFTVLTGDLDGIISQVPGARKFFAGKLTFDNAYVTGGLKVTAAQLGLNQIDFLMCGSANVATTLLAVPIKQTDGSYKIRLSTAATGAEVANASDQSAVSIEVYAVGR